MIPLNSVKVYTVLLETLLMMFAGILIWVPYTCMTVMPTLHNALNSMWVIPLPPFLSWRSTHWRKVIKDSGTVATVPCNVDRCSVSLVDLRFGLCQISLGFRLPTVHYNNQHHSVKKDNMKSEVPRDLKPHLGLGRCMWRHYCVNHRTIGLTDQGITNRQASLDQLQPTPG